MDITKIIKKFVGYLGNEEVEEIINYKEYLIIENIYSIEELANEVIEINKHLPFDLENINPDIDLYDIGKILLNNDWYIDYENNLGICIPNFIE